MEKRLDAPYKPSKSDDNFDKSSLFDSSEILFRGENAVQMQ